MRIVVTNEILELIEEFWICKLNLMILYNYDGVLQAIYYEFVFLITHKLLTELIRILEVYSLQNVNDD